MLITQYYGGYLLSSLKFAYPIDDAYSQLSMAKNFASTGRWEVITGQFSSSSNYVLYTLMLAIHFFIGMDSVFVPLLFNCIASFGVLYAFGQCLSEIGISSNKFIVFGMLFLFAVPLHYLAYMALGNTLHLWLLLLLLYRFSAYISLDNHKEKGIISISILAALTMLSGYSTFFIIFTLIILFLYKKQLSNALVFGLISLFPVIAFGAISVISGGYFIPNDYMIILADIKYANHDIIYYLTNWIVQLANNPGTGIGFIFVLGCSIYSIAIKEINPIRWISIIGVVSYIAHSTILPLDYNGLDQAYLTGFAIICFSYLANLIFYNKKYIVFIVLGMISFLILRTYPFVYGSRYDISYINSQQMQVANFVEEHLQNTPLVISSPGVISYYTNNNIFDLSMKESSPMLDYYIENGSMIEDMIAISADNISARIAIIYEDNYKELIPREWSKLATWTVTNNLNLDKSSVHFYNISFNEKNILKSLQLFESELPENVKVDYIIDPPKDEVKILPYLINGRY